MKKIHLTIIALVILLSLGLVGGALAFSPASTPSTGNMPTGTVVARVYFTSQNDLNQLAISLDIWEVNHTAGYLVAMLTPERYASLSQAGYHLEIDAERTALLNKPPTPLPGQGPDTIPGYDCYRTVEETYTTIQNLAFLHPNLVQVSDIGDSWDRATPGGPSGYNIYAVVVTNRNGPIPVASKPTFFLMAAIHAREYTTAETATRMIEHLVNNYGVDADITWLLDYYKIAVVTIANPDGRKFAEEGQLWRKNTDSDDGCSSSYGTDLNRNSSFQWGGADTDPCGETYQGPDAASEPETQAIQNYVASILPDQRGDDPSDPAPDDTMGTFITLHSWQQAVLFPWGYTSTPSPNKTQLQTLGRKFGYFNNYYVCQTGEPGCMYSVSGSTDDWSYGELGVASYTFEMGTDFFQDCASFENTIYPDNLEALMYAFKAARLPYENPKGPDSINLALNPNGIIVGGAVVTLTVTADDTRYDNNGWGNEPTQNIAEVRYSIDAPSWITGTVTYPLSPSDGSFNSKIESAYVAIDTTGISSGQHTIFVESKDADGNWGVPTAIFMFILDPAVSPTIEGYVRDGSNHVPLEATITAGEFQTTSDPVTGFYSMIVLSGTYDITASAPDYADSTANDVVASDYQTVQQDFDLGPICYLFSDDVESGNSGWTAQSPWAITTEASHSPSHSWTDSPGGNYYNYRNVSLTSPIFDFSGSAGISLNFWQIYKTEECCDFGRVEVSTDGGENWSEVARFSGTQTSWVNEEIQLPQLNGQANARIRFRFSSNSTNVSDGWHIDDIKIAGSGGGCVNPLAPMAEFTSNSPVDLGKYMVFTDKTIGSIPLTYDWDFGDGVGSSTDPNPVYLYTEAGTYTVTLTVTNELGTDSVSHPVVVEPVSCVELLSADLSLVTTGDIFAGDLVEFSVDILPDFAQLPYTYTIDFGDGTQALTGTSSNDPLSLTHTFDTADLFTVGLEAWNCSITSKVTDMLEVNVASNTCTPLEGIAILGPDEGAPVIYTFTTTYTPEVATTPITYSWDNGEVLSTSVRTLEPGTYTLTVTADNCAGVQVTDSHTITISSTESSFKVFLPLVTKTGTGQVGASRVESKSDASSIFLPRLLPIIFSGLVFLPVLRKKSQI
jgi:carboxypeptidase T